MSQRLRETKYIKNEFHKLYPPTPKKCKRREHSQNSFFKIPIRLPRWLNGKNPPEMPDPQETLVDTWVRKIPWRRACQPTPVFLPGESHGQSSLVGYSPLGCKELDRTEVT